MKTMVGKRLVRLAGLAFVILLVSATGLQAAQAMRPPVTGATASGGVTQTPPAQALQSLALAQHHRDAERSRTGVTLVAGTQTTQQQGSTERGRGGVRTAPGTQLASVTSSTTAWIVGSIAAVLIVGIGAWTLMRRRPGELASGGYCLQHPEDSLCRAA